MGAPSKATSPESLSSMLSVMIGVSPSTARVASVVMVGRNGFTRNTSLAAPADTAVGEGKVALVRRSVQL